MGCADMVNKCLSYQNRTPKREIPEILYRKPRLYLLSQYSAVSTRAPTWGLSFLLIGLIQMNH